MRIVLSIILVLITFTAFSQSRKKDKKVSKREARSSQPTTLDPGESSSFPEVSESKREAKKKSKSKGPTYNSQKEFEDRMEARAKTYRKNEKNMETPQYTNPKYFGHKRPPKKRPPGKMKFCKECGIRH